MPIARRQDITPEYVRSSLTYDPQTGVMTWNYRPDMPLHWNDRYAGKEAGCKRKESYIGIYIKNKCYLSHVLAWVIMTGVWPKHEIDHKNQDRHDCRWENLRAATRIQNSFNVRDTGRSRSGIKGVSYDKRMKSWVARIKIGHKYVILGYTKCPEEAGKLYREAAIRHHGEFFCETGVV